jgi:hypothetical protein
LTQQQSEQQQLLAAGPPYIQTQSIGGVPDSKGDIIVCALLLFLFFAGAVAHIGLFVRSKKRDRLFPMAIGAASMFDVVGKLFY